MTCTCESEDWLPGELCNYCAARLEKELSIIQDQVERWPQEEDVAHIKPKPKTKRVALRGGYRKIKK